MSEDLRDFGRMTIDEANQQPWVTDSEFKQLPGMVQDHIKAHVETKGGNWRRDDTYCRYFNKLGTGGLLWTGGIVWSVPSDVQIIGMELRSPWFTMSDSTSLAYLDNGDNVTIAIDPAMLRIMDAACFDPAQPGSHVRWFREAMPDRLNDEA